MRISMILVLIAGSLVASGCGDDSGSGTAYVLGECFDSGDGFPTCDDYCLDTFGTLAKSGVDFDGDAAGHACEVDFGSGRPAAGASTGYLSLDACQNDGEASSVGSTGSSDLFDSSSTLTFRCCCALD